MLKVFEFNGLIANTYWCNLFNRQKNRQIQSRWRLSRHAGGVPFQSIVTNPCLKIGFAVTFLVVDNLVGRSINSDWFVNSFIMVVYEKNGHRILTDNHYKTIYASVRIDRSSYRVFMWIGNCWIICCVFFCIDCHLLPH